MYKVLGLSPSETVDFIEFNGKPIQKILLDIQFGWLVILPKITSIKILLNYQV